MQTARLVNYVEESWGAATIYSFEPEDVEELEITTKVTTSEVIRVVKSTIQTPIDQESINSEDNSPRQSLRYLTSALFATAMEDAMTKFRILMECNSELRIIKTNSDMNKLIALKFGIKQVPCTDELEGIDVKQLDCETYKINKLYADRNYVADVILSTYIDLCANQRYDALEDAVNKILDSDRYRVDIQEQEDKNIVLRRELYKQLRQRRNHIKSVIYETNQTIEKLQTRVEDSGLYTNCCSRYTEKWEVARTEQHLQSIRDMDDMATEIVEYYKQRTEFEQRVHSEVDLLTNIIINETLEKIEDWMAKYDKDIEKIDMKIRVKKNDYQMTQNRRLGLEQTIEDHDVAMKDWCIFKEIRENARLYREKMTNSAITVQSWWRGLLVRRSQLAKGKASEKPKEKGKKK